MSESENVRIATSEAIAVKRGPVPFVDYVKARRMIRFVEIMEGMEAVDEEMADKPITGVFKEPQGSQ